MNVRIGNYSIAHQSHNNVTLVRHGKVTDEESKNFGQPTESVVGYYASTKSALCAVLECKIAAKDIDSVKHVLSVLESAKREIIDAVEGVEEEY